ncbi:MAG: hypothetical protein HOE62_04505 [Alphaproteobacteria bacterium]|jgi:phage terminase large subunit-like protein|nr:hypothetical protein [Alphaproteobacteria bacterium]MBT4017185.1 hypothetical protein [Alphaproteobacteria bacterium]MBT4966271.1 hypothetical protein [Alphaproteobacteria bacterium]MBT5159167.1 hypothetical protein [Alphaproteobacteria bacterium]MBT6384784.1 hypothetical protein [Alphaproteobacteria bacterium]
MKKMIFMFAGALLLISCAGAPPSMAIEKPNLLIMGEDADEDSVPRNSRVFRRVLDALTNEIHNEGFDVFDETAVSLDDFAQGRVRRTDAEIIDIAKTLKRPPIDIAVIFTIYASARDYNYTTKIKTRVTGRLLAVKSGQRLGNFEIESPREWTAKANCPRECLLETVGKYSKIIARDVGSVLAEKLVSIYDDDNDGSGSGKANINNGFSLVFDGFTEDDMMDIEEYIVVFRGYERHRAVYAGRTHHEYWYESSSTATRLNRNLRKMLDHIGVSGRVRFSGNEYVLTRISKRKKRNLDPDDW